MERTNSMKAIETNQCQCPCGESNHPIPSPIRYNKMIVKTAMPATTKRKAKRKQIKQNLRVWVPNSEEHSRVVKLSGVSLISNLLVHGKKEEALNQIGKLLFQDAMNNVSAWQPNIQILGDLL